MASWDTSRSSPRIFSCDYCRSDRLTPNDRSIEIIPLPCIVRNDYVICRSLGNQGLMAVCVMRNTGLVVVLIPIGSAEPLVASVLLDRGLGPSAERGEVGEGHGVIPVSIPQRQALELRRAAHDRTPLTGGTVDTHAYTHRIALVHHALQEVDVVSSTARPVLKSKWLASNIDNLDIAQYLSAFNVKPNHTIGSTKGSVHGFPFLACRVRDRVRFQTVDSVNNLLLWVTTTVARENIPIHMSHARVPSIVNVSGPVRIASAIRLIDSYNSKIVYK